MSKSLKRLLSWMLVVLMLLSMMPTTVFAAEEDTVPSVDVSDGTEEETDVEQTDEVIAGGEYGSTIDGTDPVTNYQAAVNGVGYETLQAAIDAAGEGDTVTLLTDLTIESDLSNAAKGYFNIAADDRITLDLNNKKITATDNSSGNFILFYNYGELTVKNVDIELTATVDRDWSAQSTIILNRGGELVVENGSYIHNGGTDMAITMDNSANSYGDAYMTVNGGIIKSAYVAVRMRMADPTLNGTPGNGVCYLTVNDGTIEGVSRGIWGQITNASSLELGALNITGGTVKGSPKAIEMSADGSDNIDVTISGNAFIDGTIVGDAEDYAVSGGTFSSDVSALLAEGYVLNQNDDGTYGVAVDPAYGMVAKIGEKYYPTLADAIANVNTDGSDTTIKLLCDVQIGDVAFTAGAGKVIFTADQPVTIEQTVLSSDFDIVNDDDIDITNVVIEENVTFQVYDNASGIYLYYGPSLELNGTITGGENWGVAYLFDGEHTISETGKLSTGRVQIGYAEITVKGEIDTNYLLVEGSELTADGAVIDANVIYDNNNGGQRWGESEFAFLNGTVVTAGTVTLSYVDSILTMDLSSSLNATKIVGAGSIVIDASAFTGEDVQVITADMSGFNGSIAVINAEDVTYEITDSGVVVTKIKAASVTDSEGNVSYYATLQAAISAAGEGDTIKLLADIALTETVTVSADKVITLDLAGYTISQTKECTASYSMIENKGSLTITGNGTISFTDTGAGDANAAWGVYTIHNAGTLVIENGTVENLSEQNVVGQSFAHTVLAIFQYSGSTTINGGTISTPNYRSVRLWSGDLIINGGDFVGQVWVHCVNDTAKLTINGGNFAPAWNDGSSVFINNVNTNNTRIYQVELNVTDGCFSTKIGANAPAELNGSLISGGTFTAAAVSGTNAALLAEGYVFQQNEDGTYGIQVALPEVVITDIKGNLTDSDPDLTFALNFAIPNVEELSEEYLNDLFEAYGSYYTDYVLTISGLADGSVTFNANGNSDGYLAGQYDAFGEGWVSVPFEDVTVADGEGLYIMAYAAELMGQPGLRYTLAEIAAIVQNFNCGVYFTPEFLAANPDLQVSLELKVFTEDAEGNITEDIPVAVNEFENNYAAAITGENKQTEYYTTFAEALAAAEAGDTVTLLADATLTSKLIIDKAVTIDGNGRSIIADENTQWYTTSGKLQIKNYAPWVVLQADGTVLKNVTINSNNCAGGVKVENAYNVVFDNVSIIGAKADALTVVGSVNFETYLKLDTSSSLIDARSGVVTADAGTVFDMTKWTASVSPATNDLKGVVDTEGDPFFCAYGSTTYYKDLTSSSYSNLTLLDDVELTRDTTISGTLDLNGHNLTIADGNSLKVSGNLTVTGGELTAPVVLTSTAATLTAPEGMNITTTLDGYAVEYVDGVYQLAQYVAQIGDVKYTSLAAALATVENGGVITLIADATEVVNIPDCLAVTLDLNGKTLNGSILAPNADLTVTNGSIVNTNSGVSGLEINAGKLTLTDVNIDSARHAIRIDGAVEAVINSGTYRSAIGNGTGTYHAANISGAAVVTVKGGTFVGPSGTTADSGCALFLRNPAKVTIEGGSFSGGKNATLGNKAEDPGVLAVSGGTFDQPVDEAYCADGYIPADNGDGTYGVKVAPKAHFETGAYAATAPSKPREHMSINVYDIIAYESLVIKVYDINGNHIVTSTYRDYDLDDLSTYRYPLIAERTTVNIVVSGKEAGSWDNVWHIAPSVDNVPATFEVWVDGIKADTWTQGFKSEEEKNEYLALEGVYKVATVTDAEGNVTYYTTIADALAAANEGDTVLILAGEYDAFTVNKAITVIGETDAEGNNLVTLNGKLRISADNAAVKNLTVRNAGDTAGVINGKDVLVEGCDLSGSNGFRWCYSSGTVTFKDSVITGTTYGIHFDGNSNGNVVIDGCTITGWTSFASTIDSVKITDTTFEEGSYNKLRFYQDAELTNVTFNSEMSVDFGKNEVTAEFNDCSVTDGSALTDVIYLPDIATMGVNVYVDDELVVVEASVTDAEGNVEYYLTLAEAIAAAEDGDTVTLLAPVVVKAGETLTLDKDITISYTSNVAGEDMITNKGTLNIGGDIKITYNNTDNTGSNVTVSTISCEPGSVLNITGGTVENKTVKADGSSIYSYAIDLLTNGNLGDVTATISGGTVYSDYMAIRQFNNGEACKNTLNVTGGYIYGARRAIQVHLKNNAAYTNITGGKVEGGDYSLCFLTTSENLTVSGGEFIGDVWYSGTDGFISGGTFDQPVEEAYCADGYIPADNGDGTYGVKLGFYVAQVGDTKYETLTEAVAAVEENGVIELLADYDDYIVIRKELTINKNGYTIADLLTSKGFGSFEDEDKYVVASMNVSAGDAGEKLAYIDTDNDGYVDETLMSLQAALDLAAENGGGTVKLTGSLTVNASIVIPAGVTLDIEKNVLTVKALVALKGAKLVGAYDSQKNDGILDGGLVKVAKEKLVLVTEPATVNGIAVLPIWDPTEGNECYRFSQIIVNTDTAKGRGLVIDEENDVITFVFKNQATTDIIEGLIANYGGTELGFDVVVRVEWTTIVDENEIVEYHNFVFDDDMIRKAAGNHAFMILVKNVSVMGIELDSLRVYASFVTDSGAAAYSDVWTAEGTE